MHLIPKVKELQVLEGSLQSKTILPFEGQVDNRVKNLIEKLPKSDKGVPLTIQIVDNGEESYSLTIDQQGINVQANGNAGAFYAVQTLRQIFLWETVPYLTIFDKPDFKYRGFYHDITRGKVPKVQTIKKLIDRLAYLKINSLQLYVEHVYDFLECGEDIKSRGFLTQSEIKEIDDYCKQNFIDFIPSLSSFGHMYEILSQPEYKHLSVLQNYLPKPNEWLNRMEHHTINPLLPESEILVKSLIDQYEQNFTSEYFNICGDETFDLKNFKPEGAQALSESQMYVDFIKKSISHVKSKGKKVMMWADILLKHPETIEELPEDTIFLNWNYSKEPSEENVATFSKLKRQQIVCPGTWSWNHLIENVDISEGNISKMAEFGFKHGAMGILNTNWGDWGNPCSIELSYYGMTLGAELGWSAQSKIDEDYVDRLNYVIYKSQNGVQYVKRLSDIHNKARWTEICEDYSHIKAKDNAKLCGITLSNFNLVQNECKELFDLVTADKNLDLEIKEELLIAIEGVCVIAELEAKISNLKIDRQTNALKWFDNYKTKWLQKNKPSEIDRIGAMFSFLENL